MFRISVIMAIIKSVALPQDEKIIITDAYYRIESFYGTKDKISMNVSVYTSKENALPGKQISSLSYIFVPSFEDGSYNFIKQGYEFLKVLPEFEGSRDDIVKEPKEELPIIEDMPMPPVEEGK